MRGGGLDDQKHLRIRPCMYNMFMYPFVLLAAETSEGSSNLKKMDIGEYMQ